MVRTGLFVTAFLMLSIAPGGYAQESIGVGLVTDVDIATSALTTQSQVRIPLGPPF
jgi:hypothetical protein